MSLFTRLVRAPGDPRVLSTGHSSLAASDRLGRGLGWLSFVLAAPMLAVPRRVTHALGLEGHEGLVRVCGARELVSGVMTLSTERQQGLWARVAGDIMDLAVLGAAYATRRRKRDTLAIALGAVGAVTLLDMIAAEETTRRNLRVGQPRSYTDRTGFPGGVAQARGAAKANRIAGAVAAPAPAPA